VGFRFERRHPVRWVDIDVQGVLNNAVYLSLMEHARYEYFSALGVLDDPAVPFTLGDVHVRYHAPGRIGDELTVRARTSRLGTKSFEMAYEILQAERLLATAEATLVWMSDGRSVPVPERVRAAIDAFEAPGSPSP